MTRLATSALIIWLSVSLIACAKSTQESVEGMINQGDEIDGMVFTTIEEYFGHNDLIQYCDMDNVEETEPDVYEIDCLASAGDQVFFGNCAGVGVEKAEEVDPAWEKLHAQVFFDERAVNLDPFGPIDTQIDDQHLRLWNLVVENIKEGEHTIHCIVEGEQTWDSTFVFNVTSADKVYSKLSGQVVSGQNPYSSESTGLDILLYLPEDYGKDSTKQWPLILYLHGYPKGLAHLEWIPREGLPELLESEANFPFIVVSPHRDEGYFGYWYQEENVMPFFQLLEEIQSLYSVDPKRIYLAGTSAGGNGVWEIGLQYPGRFAALIPVAGYYDWPYKVPDNICDLKDVPIWAFHGEVDERVPLEAQQSLVEALEACGGNAQLTVFPGVFHDVDESQVYTQEFLEWLQLQSLD